MVLPMKSDVRIYPDLSALSQAVARSLVEQINSSVTAGSSFSLGPGGWQHASRSIPPSER